MRLRTGTSGFSYGEWKGSFYPESIRPDGMLEHYAARLDTVEINNTFHRYPRPHVLEGWAAAVPPGFRFVLKMTRMVSHARGFVAVDERVRRFADGARALGPRLGPTLVQFPPWFRRDLEALERLADALPADLPCALEFRHDSWHDDAVLAWMKGRGLAWAVSDRKEERPAAARTAPFGYVRFRREAYDDASLKSWADRLRAFGFDELYVFFKHETAAPQLALRFREVFGCDD